MASVFERDTSTIGTVVGIAVLLIALVGSTFLGWEWGGSGQPVALVIGMAAALAAGWVTLRKLRD
jgi:drug/metabolite transporter (DMT)-like permease